MSKVTFQKKITLSAKKVRAIRGFEYDDQHRLKIILSQKCLTHDGKLPRRVEVIGAEEPSGKKKVITKFLASVTCDNLNQDQATYHGSYDPKRRVYIFRLTSEDTSPLPIPFARTMDELSSPWLCVF
ncbi:MAG: hypothetical protein AABX38_05515 [Candidatus Micrarchaeota archaeon]